MPKKSRSPAPVKQLTSRQLSRWQKEHRRQRIIFVIGSLVIILIVGILGYGYFTSQFAPRWQAAIKVNGSTFSTQYYVNYLRAVLGNQPKDAGSINSMTRSVVEKIQDSELVKQAALNLNISVSEDDINQAIRDSLIKPEEKDKLSETEIQDRIQKFTSNMPFPVDFLKELITADIYGKKLQEKLESQVPTQSEQVKLSAIVVDTDVTATEVSAKLQNNGDFAALSKEYSKDENTKEKGGDMGWVPRGLFPELDGVAFSLSKGTPSQPIATSNGYYILLVTDKKDSSPISDDALQVLKSRALTNWLEQARKSNKLENYLVDKARGSVYPTKLNWIVKQLK